MKNKNVSPINYMGKQKTKESHSPQSDTCFNKAYVGEVCAQGVVLSSTEETNTRIRSCFKQHIANQKAQ